MQNTAITVTGVTIPAGYVNTIAQRQQARAAYSGDGGPATSANLCEPTDAFPDTQGNVYIADADNDVIRKVASDGTITTFAGMYDTWDYTGDGGPATSASLYFPVGAALDAFGNVYIVDCENNAIRKVSPNGGGTTQDFGSIALGSNTTLPVQLYMNQAVTISAVQASGDFAVNNNAPNTRRATHRHSTTSFRQRKSMSPQANALLQKSLVRRHGRTHATRNTNGNASSCIGTFNQGDVCTTYVTFTPTKPGPRWFQLTVTDSNQVNYKIGLTGTGIGSAFSITPGIINTVPGGASVAPVTGMARDSAGNVYVADYLDHVVLQITPAGTVSTFAGIYTVSGYDGDGGPATSAHLDDPFGLSFDSTGNLYIADTLNNVIRKVDVYGIITTIAGNGTGGYTGDNGPATDAQLYNPLGVLADTAGNLYISDTFNNVVRKVTTTGKITTIAGDGFGAGVGGWYGGEIGSGSGGWSGDGGPATSAELNMPTSVSLDASGNLYIADVENSAIRKVDGSGNIWTVAGLCGDGCSPGYSGDGGPATSAQLGFPFGVAVDAAGDFYIADLIGVIRKVDVNGIINTVAGGGQQNNNARRSFFGKAPVMNARRPRASSSSGIGDGGLATSATINTPVTVLVDNDGSFYLTDVSMGYVRKIDVTTSDMNFGSYNPTVTSSAMAATVSDVGNATLNFTQLSIAANFAWYGEGLCSTTSPLAIGNSCLLEATFTPPAAGNYSGTIAITDDAFNSPHAITLEGVGTQPDYSVAASPTSLTITQGQTGTTTLTVTPVYGYTGTINFSCTGLPALSTCTFSPTSAVADGSNTAIPVTVTVHTTGKTGMASMAAPVTPGRTHSTPLYAFFLPAVLAGVVVFGAGDVRRNRGRQLALQMLFSIALLSGVVFMTACGSDSHAVPVTPPGTYTTTVTTTATATGGNGQHTAAITITIVQ